jgi:predicted anti-sigma-YlaC factor YlaD
MDSAREHLRTCNACTKVYTGFADIDALINHEKIKEPNPFVSTRILRRIENEFIAKHQTAFPNWVRLLQPVALAVALISGILLGSYTAKKENGQAINPVVGSQNIEFLRSNLFITEFTDEDKVLDLNN